MRQIFGGFFFMLAFVIFYYRQWIAGFVVLAFAVYFIVGKKDDGDSGSGFEFEAGGDGGGDGGGCGGGGD